MEDKKIKFTLVYNGLEVDLTVNKEFNLSFIYSEAYNFFKLKRRFKLQYKNKDLTPFLDYQIGVFFKNLTNVHLLVKESDIYIRNNKLNKSNSQNNIRSLKNKIFPNLNNRMICFECKNNLVNYFCRNCGVFICNECKLKKDNKHNIHRTVILYHEDLKKSAMLYKNLVYVDLEDSKNSHKNSLLNVNNCDANIENLHEKLIQKFHVLISKIASIKKKILNVDLFIQEKNSNIIDINNRFKEIQDINIDEMGNNVGEGFRLLNKCDQNILKYHIALEQFRDYEYLNGKLNYYLNRIHNKINEEILIDFPENKSI